MGSEDSMTTGGVATSAAEAPRRERRKGGWLWGAGAAGAGLLVLGVNGTLATWSTAIINNDQSEARVTDSYALQEYHASSGTTCTSASSSTNEASCAVDLYSGAASYELDPGDPAVGDSHTERIELTNVGSTAGTLYIDADACAQSGGASAAVSDICDNAGLSVDVTCEDSGTSSVYTGSWATLKAFADEATDQTFALGLDETVTCDVTVTLAATAPADLGGQVGTQTVTFTLKA
ncbi:hypothetical protein E8D34_16960 [Nocardioides sp. GY 10113]|uniref:hypothetical protein n=1 Tax=Nocardioides sp. GY 10113 TaxID=2569761 RepID=UPI0010A80CF5|nr:hypothetical protein [Nocardioides sp. GY 10113]TIC82507.1 hypothetical protein E8D34_16960 [Nocardioides sp. GY 10113]